MAIEKVENEYYRVFNAAQCENIKIPDNPANTPDLFFEPIAACENVVDNMPNPPEIFHSISPKAYYSPGRDIVHIPDKKTFENVENYYSTLFHELSHSAFYCPSSI